MKIAIERTGYVGISNGILLAQHNEVIALDLIPEKVEMINRKQSHIEDKEYLRKKPFNFFKVTLDKDKVYKDAAFVAIATQTDCDPETNYYKRYQKKALKEKNVTFIGRLGTYKYMGMGIKEALEVVVNYAK